MAALTTGKAVELFCENFVETHEEQTQMLDLVSRFEMDGGAAQRAGNFVWRGVQQHAPIISGWDLTGQATGIIQETYPAQLGTPNNDLVELRADDMRDSFFWTERGKESAKKQASELNKQVANTVLNQGSLFIRTNTTSGFNFIAGA